MYKLDFMYNIKYKNKYNIFHFNVNYIMINKQRLTVSLHFSDVRIRDKVFHLKLDHFGEAEH